MSGVGDPAPGSGAPVGQARLLDALEARMAAAGTMLELYLLGGAVMSQAFAAAPRTAHVRAMFRPPALVESAVAQVGRAHGAPERWLHDAVRSLLSPEASGRARPAYLELPHLRVFAPPPEYVLAVKCASLSSEEADRELDDLRYVLRSMELRSAEEALGLAQRYFTARQLPTDLPGRLEALLPS